MKRSTESYLARPIYTRLKSIRMPDYQRQSAIDALVIASLFVNACAWLAQTIRSCGALIASRRTATR